MARRGVCALLFAATAFTAVPMVILWCYVTDIHDIVRDIHFGIDFDDIEVQFQPIINSTSSSAVLSSITNASGLNPREPKLTAQERSQFQKAQLDEFCKLRNRNTNRKFTALGRHLLLDVRHKVMFCFVPKAGCSHLIVMFLTNQGLLPLNKTDLYKYMQGAMEMADFGHLNETQKLVALREYFRFIIVRNPLERLFSGYRDKIIRLSLSTLQHNEPQFNYFRKSIFQFNHPVEYRQWAKYVKVNGRSEVSLELRTFGDFVNYWSVEPPNDIRRNEHFQPVLELCQPCLVRYDHYGNFNSFRDEAGVLMDKVQAPEHLLRSGEYTNTSKKAPTNDIYHSYYKELSLVQKKAVLRVLSAELDFYYHVFPEELDCHKEIMDIQDDIVRPYVH